MYIHIYTYIYIYIRLWRSSRIVSVRTNIGLHMLLPMQSLNFSIGYVNVSGDKVSRFSVKMLVSWR